MATIDTEFQTMLDDCHEQLGQATTIVLAATGTFTSTTGTRVEGVMTASVNAIRSMRRSDPFAAGSADVMEVVYRVRVTDSGWAGGIAKRGYKVTDAGVTLYVHRVEKEVNDLEWVLYCRSTKPVG